MKNCFNCGALLFENARFCHECGAKTLIEEVVCKACNSVNLMTARFCNNCGEPLFTQSKQVPPKSAPSDSAGKQNLWHLKQQFFDALKKRIDEEHQPSQYTAYVEHIELSGFHKDLDVKVQQLLEAIERLKADSNPAVVIEAHKQIVFEELLDYFIIRHCRDLNQIPLPEKILKYQHPGAEPVDKFTMTLDYLDFENEEETVYVDFIAMPVKKLKNAGTSFLKPEKNEKIYFICDQSLIGSCKEGFAMTDKAIYWKAPLQKSQKIDYQHLTEIKREQEWLLLNGIFFNAKPSLNLKMLKLLKKLRSISA